MMPNHHLRPTNMDIVNPCATELYASIFRSFEAGITDEKNTRNIQILKIGISRIELLILLKW